MEKQNMNKEFYILIGENSPFINNYDVLKNNNEYFSLYPLKEYILYSFNNKKECVEYFNYLYGTKISEKASLKDIKESLMSSETNLIVFFPGKVNNPSLEESEKYSSCILRMNYSLKV